MRIVCIHPQVKVHQGEVWVRSATRFTVGAWKATTDTLRTQLLRTWYFSLRGTLATWAHPTGVHCSEWQLRVSSRYLCV